MKRLKLFFACLLMAVLSIGQVWAETVEFTPSNCTNWTSSSANQSQTIDGITISSTAAANNTQLRLYSGGTHTFTSTVGNITKIEFTCTASGTNSNGPGKMSLASGSAGSYSYSGTLGTWTGDAATCALYNGQSRCTSIVVTYTPSGGGSTCATPTFDPEDGEKFDESIDVEINAEDGATIYYTTDGNAPTTSSSVYSTALHFTETTTLKAMAVKAGSNNSAVATATYTKIVTVPGYAIDFESELDAYVDWEFSNIGIRTSTITAHGGTYYGSNVNGNGNATATAAIKTKAKVATPGALTFYISKESNNTTASSWKAQVSADGSEWTDVETFDAKSMSKGAWNECTADLSEYSNVYVRIYYEGSQAIRAIDDIELAEASAVAKPAISGETPFLTSTEVTMSCTTDGAEIYYTTTESAKATPATSGDWNAYDNSNKPSFSATTTVWAAAKKNDAWSAVAEKTFTKATVLTVADAIALIPNKNDVVNDQYVAGIVCTAAPSLLSGGKLTYYISADGSETNRLQIYKGKNLNNTEFTAVSNLAIGDRVTVFGQLMNFNNTPEMNDGNYLVSKEVPAVAAPEFTPNGGGFMGETDVTITCETEGSAIYYTLDGTTTPTKSSTPYEGAIHLDATTTIKAIAYVGDDASLVITKTFTLTDPMTVADALTALDTEDPINNVAVTGIVSTAPTSDPSSGKLTYKIADAIPATDELEVFNGYGLNGASFSAKTDLQVGDEVTVFGNLTIFNSTTKEFASGSRLLAFNRPQVDVTGINLTESTASVEEGKTVTLHASVVPANATNKTIVWSVQSGDDYASVDENGVVTGIVAGEAVIRAASDEDATIFAECTVTVTEPAPLSPWASVYTSNVTLSTEGGTSASAAKVKFYGEEGDGYDALKAGTSGAVGAVVINVPAGATALHFHAYSWYNETVELTVSAPTGVTVTPSEAIAINKNSGIANNSPFTLAEGSDPKTDAYYAVSLSGNTEPVALTISATAGKRFVLFGVNQEGGLVLESISITGTATALEYTDGQHFDPTGLSVTGHYSDASTAPITEDIVWAFDPDPLTEGTTSVSVTATAAGFTSAAFVVNGLTVAGAAPLSPWATTWTSNLDDITGSKVKFYGEEAEYAALKAGSSGTAGSATLNIPAQATELHLHAYGWNSEDVTLSITAPAGVTVTPASITLNRNSGFANNSPFTLAEGSTPQTDAYYALSLSGNTDAIELTISATAGKRFLLFGVNQVGGVLPVLDHITITGTMTNTTGWKTGDNIVPEGLTVNAIYTLNNVEQTPVEVDPNDVVWSHAALVENQTEVTLTATYEGKNANKVVTIDAVETGDPAIITDPASYLNFGASVEKDAVVAPKTITVTLKNIAGATATLGGTNYSAFSIDDTEIVDGDVITVSVNTGTIGVYAGTVTIKDNNSETQKVIDLSMTVVAPEIPETAVSTTSEWVPAEAADIKDGAVVLITGVKDDVTYAIGVQNDNNRAAVAGTLSEGVFTPGENTMAFTLVAQEGGTFALQASNGEYLYAASSTKNYLKRQATIDDNAKWTLTATSAVANGTNTHNDLKFNGTNSPKIFSCYGSGNEQMAIQLYVPKPVTPPTPVYEEVRTGLQAGHYYTLCFNKKMTAVQGATFWSLVSKEGNLAYLVAEDAPYAAGKPYIIYAEAEGDLTAVLEGDAIGVAGTNGALHGTFENMDQAALDAKGTNIYVLSNNSLVRVDGQSGNSLNAYRAYIALDELGSGAPLNVPAHRVRAIPMGQNTVTGIDELNASETPVKMIIDGQLYILRGEKMYNANGQIVK